MSIRWPVAVSALGSLEHGSLLWTYRGACNVTIVLRTSYALAAGPPSPLPADPVDWEDRHYGDAPARAVRTAADLSPRVPIAEIVHAGAVFAPAGVTMVRLALSREGRVVFDKRALASAQNDSPGLGPLGRRSAERLAALRGGREPFPGANGVVAFPDDHDFAFHQCAPADQRCERLVGGDQILLGNLHPDLAEVIVTLPTTAPAARAILGSEEAPLVLECKRVLLDTDRRRVTLTWYAELELPGFEAIPHLRVDARAPDAPVPQAAPAFDPRQMLRRIAATPASSPPMAPAAYAPAAAAAPPAPVAAYAPPAPAAAVAAYAPPSYAPPAYAPPVAQRTPMPSSPPGPAGPGGTVQLDPGAPSGASAAASGTLIVAEPTDARPVLPFAGRPVPVHGPVPAPASATPWGAAPLAPAPQVSVLTSGTMAMDDDDEPPMGAPRPPPPAPPPPGSVPPPAWKR